MVEMDLRRFEGKSVLVTGAGFGIGRGVALRFAREGARVGVMDVNGERAAETVQMIKSAGGVAHAVIADVSNAEEVRRAVDEVSSRVGTINILVNNAGIRLARNVLEMTDEEWNRTISTNLSGVFYVTKAVAPRMLANGGGKIVNVASMSGLIGQLKRAAYGASKGGELQLTRSLAVELGPTINVNAVAPGYIAGTGITADVDKDAAAVEWNLAYTPVHRAGNVDDVAGAVAFLASEDASFITGATLVVDGGFTAAKFMPPG
jgi:NAD(P)-dependent dehydrogenase (short-subunit alcohol dehydrogenase family)